VSFGHEDYFILDGTPKPRSQENVGKASLIHSSVSAAIQHAGREAAISALPLPVKMAFTMGTKSKMFIVLSHQNLSMSLFSLRWLPLSLRRRARSL